MIITVPDKFLSVYLITGIVTGLVMFGYMLRDSNINADIFDRISGCVALMVFSFVLWPVIWLCAAHDWKSFR